MSGCQYRLIRSNLTDNKTVNISVWAVLSWKLIQIHNQYGSQPKANVLVLRSQPNHLSDFNQVCNQIFSSLLNSDRKNPPPSSEVLVSLVVCRDPKTKPNEPQHECPSFPVTSSRNVNDASWWCCSERVDSSLTKNRSQHADSKCDHQSGA